MMQGPNHISETRAPDIQCPVCLAWWIEVYAFKLTVGSLITCPACEAELLLVEQTWPRTWSFEEYPHQKPGGKEQTV